MDVETQLVLATLDYELHAGAWPIAREVTLEYLAMAHARSSVDRELLDTVATQYLGRFRTPGEAAEALTRQSFSTRESVNVDVWPFTHIDWVSAGAQLEDMILSEAHPPIVRVAGEHYFAPGQHR